MAIPNIVPILFLQQSTRRYEEAMAKLGDLGPLDSKWTLRPFHDPGLMAIGRQIGPNGKVQVLQKRHKRRFWRGEEYWWVDFAYVIGGETLVYSYDATEEEWRGLTEGEQYKIHLPPDVSR